MVEEVNGHDHIKLEKVLRNQKNKKPTIILANTIKGKGVSFMKK